MLKGDLSTTPILTALGSLADEQATGCLHVVDDEGGEALVYLKAGLVYAVSVPGQRPQLGSRLISSNALVPENLAEALEAQRTELQGWRLGELLVHLGFVEQEVVEAFVQEQVRDGLTDLLAWTSGRWRFRKAEKTREDVAPPTPLNQLLDDVRARQSTWEDIVDAVHGPNAVPMLAPHGGEAHITLDPDTWSLLCKIDGERSIAELARECGFTLFEAGSVVRVLVEAGLVDVEEDVGPDGLPTDLGRDDDEVFDSDSGAAPDPDSFPRTAALAAAFALGGREPTSSGSKTAPGREPTIRVEESQTWHAPEPAEEPEVSTLAQVSEALTRALGPRPESADAFVDPFHVPDEIRLRPPPKMVPQTASKSEDQLRRERIRQAAAAELAAAHADAEAQHNATKRPAKPGHIAEVVDLEARREAARVEVERRSAERLEAERLEAERIAVEQAAAAEAERIEAERIEAERLEAERIAAEQAAAAEAERIAAEQAAAAEAAARAEAEEAARLVAEETALLAAEEAGRLEAERLEIQRMAAEEAALAAAEEAARAEAERLEAERLAAEEAARVAAEEAVHLAAEEAARLEAERLEAERIAAEEAARVAAEEAARLEAERLEAERIAAEEAARLEAERLEAERIAAEEAARLEAERIAAEEEAARIEGERLEAERIAAEEARLEAERLAAEEAARLEAERVEAERVEAERIAAEEEAARLEAERLEAERIAAEEEAARLEAERLEAERVAAEEEAARLAAEQYAAAEAAWLAEYNVAPVDTDWSTEHAQQDAREQLAAAQAAADVAAQLEAEQQEREAAERAESDRIVAVNQMMAQASAPTHDPGHLASVNAMLSEFSRTDTTTVAESAGSDLEPEPEPDYESAFQPLAQRDLADTASLLRELSSLGFEDEPPAPSGPRPGGQTPGATPPRPTPSAVNQQKKKRGLFGR